MRRHVIFRVVLLLLLLSTGERALAAEFVIVGPRQMGMGGAGAQARRDHQCAQALRNGGGRYGWRCH